MFQSKAPSGQFFSPGGDGPKYLLSLLLQPDNISVQADGVSVQRRAISQPRGSVRLDGTYLNPSGQCFSPGGTVFQSRWGNISARGNVPAHR